MTDKKTEPVKAEPVKAKDADSAVKPAQAKTAAAVPRQAHADPAAVKASKASDVAAFSPEDGEKARNETMTPGPLKAEGQAKTVSGAKNG